jgi:hypothetical protein
MRQLLDAATLEPARRRSLAIESDETVRAEWRA